MGKPENRSSALALGINAILGTDEKTLKNILKDFHSRFALYSDPLVRHATSDNTFDFREIRREKMSIYINVPDSDKERLRPLLTLFWSQFLQQMTKNEPNLQEEPYGVLALIDEFGNMSRIDPLKNGMSFLRSYRIRAIAIVQYLGQISSIYGREDSKAFLNTKVKIAYALTDYDDAQFFSKMLGKKTVVTTSSAQSFGNMTRPGHRSKSKQHQSRALMSAEEIMQLKKNEQIIVLEGSYPIKATKPFYYQDPILKEWIRTETNGVGVLRG